jgi:hypothetical protein
VESPVSENLREEKGSSGEDHVGGSVEARSGKNPVENVVEPGISPDPGSGQVPTFAVPKVVNQLPSKSARVPLNGAERTRRKDRSTKKLPKTRTEKSPRSKNPVAHRTRTKHTQKTLQGYVTSSSDGSRETSPAPVRRRVTEATVSPPNTRTGDEAAKGHTKRTSRNKGSKKLPKKNVKSKRSPTGTGAAGTRGRGGNRGGRGSGGHGPDGKGYTRKVPMRAGARR